MSLSADSILAQLQKRQFAPVYFLQGEEPYYIDQISDWIEQHALPEHEKSFNQVVIYGKDADMGTVLLQCQALPDDGRAAGSDRERGAVADRFR